MTRSHLGAHREVEATERPHIIRMKTAHWDARLATSRLKLGLGRDATELTCGTWRHHVGSKTETSGTEAVRVRDGRTRALRGHVLRIVALLEELLLALALLLLLLTYRLLGEKEICGALAWELVWV